MPLRKAVQGAKRPSQRIQWVREDDTPEDLTGATLSGYIHSEKTGLTRDIEGLLTVVEPEEDEEQNGEFDWAFADEDVAEAGTFLVQFRADFPESPTPAKTFETVWVVEKSRRV